MNKAKRKSNGGKTCFPGSCLLFAGINHGMGTKKWQTCKDSTEGRKPDEPEQSDGNLGKVSNPIFARQK